MYLYQGGSVEEGGLAAFALALILSIDSILQHLLKQFSQLNISMAAVARIQRYLEVPAEPPLVLPSDKGTRIIIGRQREKSTSTRLT